MVGSSGSWRIRLPDEDIDPLQIYGLGTTLFSIKLFHGGRFHNAPTRVYKGGKIDWVDLVDADEMSAIEINHMVTELGYRKGDVMYYHYKIPGETLHDGLMALAGDQDIIEMTKYVATNKVIEVYVEHECSTVWTYLKSPFKTKKDNVVIEEIPSDVEIVEPMDNSVKRNRGGMQSTTSTCRRLMLEWHKEGHDHGSSQFIDSSQPACSTFDSAQKKGQTQDWLHKFADDLVAHIDEDTFADMGQDREQPVNIEESEYSDTSENSLTSDSGSTDSQKNSDDSSDSDYEQPFFDAEHETNDVEVDMRDFMVNVDPTVEWCGHKKNREECGESSHVDVEGSIPMDEVEQLSASEDEVCPGREKRKFPQYLRSRDIGRPEFYVGQEFGTTKEVKEAVRVHAIQTRRELVNAKNDNRRIRVRCEGKLPGDSDDESTGSGKEESAADKCEKEKSSGSKKGKPGKAVGSDKSAQGKASGSGKGKSSASGKGKGNKEKPKKKGPPPCPWVLLVSRSKNSNTWQVSTYKDEHICLQSRDIKHFTSTYLAGEIEDTVKTNPTIPVKSLSETLQKQYQMNVSRMKAFRAKAKAHDHIIGSYKQQYAMLRDYAEELWRSNPGTTVRIDVEPCAIPHEPTRIFRRIYICLGALKNGFKAGCRRLLGLDGSFMKGPYPGQLLSAVGVDANNQYYPVAYAIVEAETFAAWCWFLELLGEDLDIHKDSNFTFISDRQKGLIPALAKCFPVAEHRFCLRHLQENLKKSYRGKVYKDFLWNAATATTVAEFQRKMAEVEAYNIAAHNWFNEIGHHHWTRSHFSGIAQCDILYNNICESFNKQLVGGRDKPIITALEFVRSYLMKRLVAVEKTMKNCHGPLCPDIAKIFETIKSKASAYRVSWNGEDKYEVCGLSGDQCVVNLVNKNCTCRKWELTGMPCSHAVAAIWDLGLNGGNGIPERWVDDVYKLDTWKKIYSFKVQPINGANMWSKSNCPSTLLPPLYHVPPGRPRKARRKDAEEVEAEKKRYRENRKAKEGTSGKLSRSAIRLTCTKCGNQGHNQRTCKGQRDDTVTKKGNVGKKANDKSKGGSRSRGSKKQKTGDRSTQETGMSQTASVPRPLCDTSQPTATMHRIPPGSGIFIREPAANVTKWRGMLVHTQVNPKDKGKEKAHNSQP